LIKQLEPKVTGTRSSPDAYEDLDRHAIKALLVSRALLVKVKRDIENRVRGLHSPFRPVLILIA
jgi:hypothetical protein